MKNILVIGLGLIGGSIAKSLNTTKFNVFGIDANSQTIEKALNDKIISQKFNNVKEFLAHYDDGIILFATPPSSVIEIIESNKEILDTNFSLTDVSSSKLNISRFLDRYEPKNFVFSHPIAGSHKSGYENSRKDFLNQKKVIISKYFSQDEHYQTIRELWTSMKTDVVQLSVDEHENIFSATSHLPHLISYALIKTINEKDIDVEKFSAGGLSEFIRLTKSSEALWSDIFKSNHENIEKDIEAFVKNMYELLEDASKKDSKSLLKKIQLIKKGVG
tara:strand:- start:1469 stop:2293 length:825 start_codon:yes stop_codon:yes gene_type:complete